MDKFILDCCENKIIISQFCQIVKDCYWNVDRLFQDDEKLPYLH